MEADEREFMERLAVKERHLDDQIRKLEAAMANLSELTEKVNSRDNEVLYSPKRHVYSSRKLVKKKKTTKETNPKRAKSPLGLTQSRKELKRRLKERVSSPIKRNPNERQITKEYSFLFEYEPTEPVQVQSIPRGPTRTIYANGDTKTQYPDGTVKIKTLEGMLFTKYSNGDYQQQYPDGASCYRYISNKSIELRTKSGHAVFIFDDGQREEHNPDGSKRINFVNGSVMEISADGSCKIMDRKGRIKTGKVE